jgi:Na+-driven multidrug efflux pump
VLDYVFINSFGLGVGGIAFATLLCEMLTLLYLFYKLSHTQLWDGIAAFSYDATVMRELFKQGFPPSINMFMMAFGMYIITYYVAPFGKEAVAAFGIGMRIEQIFLMPVIGLNIAALAIISQNNGAKAYERIEPALRLGIRYGWMMSTLGVSVFLLFAESLAGLLSSDAQVIEQTALYLRVSGVASYGFVIIFLYIAMLQGIAKPSIITPISIYRQVIAPILLLSALAFFEFGIFALWMGLNAIIFSAAIFLWWYGERELKNLHNRQGEA